MFDKSRHRIASFLNCSKGCYDTHYRKAVGWFNKLQSEWQKKALQSRNFIENAMVSHKLLDANKSPNNAGEFHNCNHTAPYPQPPRKMDHRQQLDHSCHNKNKIGNRVQLTTKLTGAVCFSGNGAVSHITKTAEEIYDIKLAATKVRGV